MQRNRSASAPTVGSSESLVAPRPWSITTGSPVPACRKECPPVRRNSSRPGSIESARRRQESHADVQVAPDRQAAAPERVEAAAHVGGDALPDLGLGRDQRRRAPLGRLEARPAGLEHGVELVLAARRVLTRARVSKTAGSKRPVSVRKESGAPGISPGG
jgi:hypothetical protein